MKEALKDKVLASIEQHIREWREKGGVVPTAGHVVEALSGAMFQVELSRRLLDRRECQIILQQALCALKKYHGN